ncbi:MAG: hypothetical protein QOI63_1587 [Thermoplasmata archaeon]|jgi:hypothetical protein|nr:hypothetical protein [Thermoplasmata archaeon]
MQTRWSALLVVALAGCLSAPTPPPAEPQGPHLSALEAPGAGVLREGANLTFSWTGQLGQGAQPPLVTGSLLAQFDHATFQVPLDASVGTVTVALASPAPSVAQLRMDDTHLACVARSGRTCTSIVHAGKTQWPLVVTSLAPQGTSFELKVTLSPFPPARAHDPTPAGPFDVHTALDPAGKPFHGGEPTLAVLKDERVLVAASSHVARLEISGAWTDVSPPLDGATSQTLDPFLAADPVTGRVYVSQLASCMRLSWTDTGGDDWTTNPFVCAGPDQHHQKLAIGPGPLPLSRMVSVATMNLASWLASDRVVITHSRSLDGGVTWTQNPAMVDAVAGMEAHAVGNLAASDDGSLTIIAYLCDGFVDAPYHGVGVGRSTDLGATWTWQRIHTGSGRCEGIDPGLTVSGKNAYAMWEDASAGVPSEWYASSADSGATWGAPARIPTPGLGSFALTDAAASPTRVAAAFLATPDTTKGPTQADGWARWYPYVAVLNVTQPGATWVVERLQDDPVQVGPICMDGPMCLDGARNLLDFIDVQFGPDGRIHVAYPDGCGEGCAMPWQSRGDALHLAIERI